MALGAWFTDLIGLHAVFGAFVMGAAMPRGIMCATLLGASSRSPGVAASLFFTYSGLNTKIGLLNTGFLWLMAARCLSRRWLAKAWPAGWPRALPASPTAKLSVSAR